MGFFCAHRPNNKTLVFSFPISSKLRNASRTAVPALFIEVHSKLVVWWLVNAWRSKQLADATWQLADSIQIIPAAACARSLLETAAAVWIETRKLREIWSKVKTDHASNGPNVSHWLLMTSEINKMLWAAKFDNKAPRPEKMLLSTQRPNVLTQIEKLARSTDCPVQEDYQWLCNAVHPSIGGMLAFSAPLMGHDTKTSAFQYVCETPGVLKQIEGGGVGIVDAWKKKDLSKKPNDPHASESESRENTIQEAIVRAATLAVDVLEKTLDGALKLVDDIGLTSRAPAMASFDYWRI
jgi:hypothetical protein